jgi:hypothetical protein
MMMMLNRLLVTGNAGNLLYGIEIPEQGQVQNCSFLFKQQSKQNSNENEATE